MPKPARPLTLTELDLDTVSHFLDVAANTLDDMARLVERICGTSLTGSESYRRLAQEARDLRDKIETR